MICKCNKYKSKGICLHDPNYKPRFREPEQPYQELRAVKRMKEFLKLCEELNVKS